MPADEPPTPSPGWRLHLVQVGLSENVSAVARVLDGSRPDGVCTFLSHLTLNKFLARPNLECPPGTPLIRLYLTGDDFYFDHLAAGPHWDAHLPPGHVRPPLAASRRHTSETWADMPRWWLPPDVYAALAPTAGVTVQDAAAYLPTAAGEPSQRERY